VTHPRGIRWTIVLSLALAGCGSATEPRGGNDRITAIFSHGFSGPIIDRSGKKVGSVTGRPGDQGLIVAFQVGGLSPGQHGIHLHAVGRCDPPDFASSGPHWNASGHKHGTDNPQGPHDGDWDNLDVGADGRGSSDRLIPRWHGRIPETGLSLVIHANRDDEVTDPSGNSGERVACAIIIPGVR
jgi:superoxide dismutase, Cu-Zn family